MGSSGRNLKEIWLRLSAIRKAFRVRAERFRVKWGASPAEKGLHEALGRDTIDLLKLENSARLDSHQIPGECRDLKISA
jgi:hypothetical protein